MNKIDVRWNEMEESLDRVRDLINAIGIKLEFIGECVDHPLLEEIQVKYAVLRKKHEALCNLVANRDSASEPCTSHLAEFREIKETVASIRKALTELEKYI